MLAEGNITAEDLDLFHLTDDPQEIADLTQRQLKLKLAEMENAKLTDLSSYQSLKEFINLKK